MYFAIVVIINKAFTLFQLVLVVYLTPVDIGDTQGTLQAKKMFETLYKCPETLV